MKINCVAICLSVALTICIFMLCHLPPAACDDWSASCASNCTCKWTNGKKSAICSSLQLNTIPTTLSTELQVLVLNDNQISYLNREEFTNLGLLNLQRIYLKKSEVQYIHKETFKNLKILVEIDLSDNKIEMIDVDTFQGNDRLRILYLNGNPLKRLVAYQFPMLPHLRTLDLHDCLIAYIDPMALANLSQLEFLNLKNNLLESLNEYVFQHMSNLKTLVLDENPWQCNCKLRKFRSWYVRSKLNSISLSCKGPPVQKDHLWEQVAEEQFGCTPRVELFNTEDVQNIDIGSNTTFSCLVYGDPLPEVIWELNGKLLDSDNVIFDADTVASDKLWSNVTIFNMTSLDAGTYACSGINVVGTASQNISIYLTEIVQHVLVKTPETFWYFGLIMGTFGTVFLLILISFVVCLCKRTTRQRRHPNKPGGVKGSISFNDQEKKLLDLSITTTTNDRGDSCGIDNSVPTGLHKTESTVMGFEPIEIHSVEAHRQGHGHHGMLVSGGGHHQQQQQHLTNRQQLMSVPEGSCGMLGIPTSMANNAMTGVTGTHGAQIPEEFPLNVGVFPPPPEFCSNVVSNPAYGNIFISVSVTQDMLDGTDLSMYPDLLNIPQRIQDNNNALVQSSCGNANTSTSIMTTSGSTAAVNVSSFATLPRNTQRRGILKKDSSLQHQQQQQALQQQHQTNLYPHDEIVSYHNLDTTYSQGYQEHQQQQQQQRLLHASNMIGLPPPPPPPAAAPASTNNAACAGCLNSLPTSNCSTPPIDATPLRPLCKATACLKYDNMGRRITASGNSTLSLPDEEQLENETLFNDGNPNTFISNSGGVGQQTQSCKQQQQHAMDSQQTPNGKSEVGGGGADFVSL